MTLSRAEKLDRIFGTPVYAVLLATVIFTLSGPWNKAVTKKADSFAV